MMAKAQDLQAQLDGKRRELEDTKKAATAATQEAIAARSALSLVTDEQQAISLVAKERVQSNRARALNEQAGRLETEIADFERQMKEQAVAALRAKADSLRPSVAAQLWKVYEAAVELDEAETAARNELAMLTGDPYVRNGIMLSADSIGNALEAFGVATWSTDARTGKRVLLRKAAA